MHTSSRTAASARTWAIACLLTLPACAVELDPALACIPDDPPPTTTSLRGLTACEWGSADCNPCVPNVQAAFADLAPEGDILGFHLSSRVGEISRTDHWQGIQRLMPGQGRYLAVSRKGARQAFVIVEMRSRNAAGGRLGANRVERGSFGESSSPPAGDAVVRIEPQDPGFDHAGGLQALGKYLSVPLSTSGRSRVVYYDVSNPAAPVRLHSLDHTVVNGETDIGTAGTSSLTKLANGHFLQIVGRYDSKALDFYVSSTTSMATPRFAWFTTWTKGQGIDSTIDDFEWGSYQSLNLVNQCDGTLYLVGTRNSGVPDWKDWAVLYRLDLDGASRAVSLTKVAKHHVDCGRGEVDYCNLDAAAGVYVAPDRSLVLYATEHDNDGPGHRGGLGSVKLEEFGAVHGSSCPILVTAPIEPVAAGVGSESQAPARRHRPIAASTPAHATTHAQL